MTRTETPATRLAAESEHLSQEAVVLGRPVLATGGNPRRAGAYRTLGSGYANWPILAGLSGANRRAL